MQLVSSANAAMAGPAASRGRIAPRAFDRSGPERGHLRRRRRDEQPSLSFERHGQRERLDLDDAVTPADIERRVRFERGFSPDLAWDDQPSGRIHGGNHGTYSTIPFTTWCRSSCQPA